MKNSIAPTPNKINLLLRLREIGIPISEVVDVGVREKTGELIQVFPDRRHHLFEPVISFFSDIRKNYSEIDYKLYPIALSDETRTMYLIQSSLGKDGIVTHSAISNESVPVDGSHVIMCDKLLSQRFIDLGIAIKRDFLLKVDVDGQDINVLRGFGNEIALASVVIVEATYVNLAERLTYLNSIGFQLFDIVDLVYYGPGLYQCDIVFIRNDFVNNQSRPDINVNFNIDFWRPINL